VKVILQDIKKLETEALIVGFYQDVRPLKGLAGELDWLLCGSLSDLILHNRLNGSLGDVALLTSRGKVPAVKIFMVGLGPKEGKSLSSLRAAARIAAMSAVGAGVTNAAIEFFDSPGVPYDKVIAALSDGLSDGAKGNPLTVSLLATDAATYDKLSQLVRI
jgi:hypothetical protein